MALTKQQLTRYYSSLKTIAEVIIVLTLGFGLFIYSSTKTAFFSDSIATSTQDYNSYDFAFIILYDFIILSIIVYFLKYRRWTIKDFNLDFTPIMLGIGLILAFVRISSGIIVSNTIEFINILSPNTVSGPAITLHTNFLSTAIIVVVNSFFEEFLLIGYLFKRFEKMHPAFVILISAIIRASYHTYQGLNFLPSILIMATIFGAYYIKYKKLWPLIIAHAIGNTFYFLNHHYHWLIL